MIDEELQQWFSHTEMLIAELLGDGTNDEVYHTIEHHFASSDFDLLEKTAIAAFKLGLEIEEPEEAELENGDKVFAFDIVTEQMLEVELIKKETQAMFELAKKCGVDYDGWGTYFEE
ncbi:ribonuclease E inhibitor RraB [Colwellia ponticola]|uniref:Regulator of ribonuclease activity B n=1 Tax=Colwellia ponticola TaxID=2304625 RepID=A0A8H2JLV0_9GAMM|nr:ribonuclease E inhibitor RraB [Colwellia ponticola]TMM46062.1 ribonuclease E inhibitor RraB [Colwellia ponticola]